MHFIIYAGYAVSFGCAAWFGFVPNVRHRPGWSLLLPLFCLCLALGATEIAILFGHVFPRPADILDADVPTMVLLIGSTACLAASAVVTSWVALKIKPGAGNNKKQGSRQNETPNTKL